MRANSVQGVSRQHMITGRFRSGRMKYHDLIRFIEERENKIGSVDHYTRATAMEKCGKGTNTNHTLHTLSRSQITNWK
jgi:hypothetical protein